jgi:hypothetical protein
VSAPAVQEESPFIDRAGNIRLDTLITREDVRDAIRAAAKKNNDFIGDRRTRGCSALRKRSRRCHRALLPDRRERMGGLG